MKLTNDVVINIREQVKHSDNNKHNYLWRTFKKGSEVPEAYVEEVKARGGCLSCEKVKEEKVVEEVKEEAPVEVEVPEDLKSLNREEQIALCKKLGIKGYSKLKEDELIKLIEEHK